MVQAICFGLTLLEIISWGRWAWEHGLQWKTGQRGNRGPEEGTEALIAAEGREKVNQGADPPLPSSTGIKSSLY